MRPKIKMQMTIEDHEFLKAGHLFKQDTELEKMSIALRNVSSKMRHAFPEFSVANCLFPPVSPVG